MNETVAETLQSLEDMKNSNDTLLNMVKDKSKNILIIPRDKNELTYFSLYTVAEILEKDMKLNGLSSNRIAEKYSEMRQKMEAYLNDEIPIIAYPDWEDQRSLLNYGDYIELDKNIARAVLNLRYHKFNTDYSCQGHFEKMEDGAYVTTSPYISLFMIEEDLKTLMDIYFKSKDLNTQISFETRSNYLNIYHVHITIADQVFIDFEDSYGEYNEKLEEVFKNWIDKSLAGLIDCFLLLRCNSHDEKIV